jgi:hypothetical protein
VSGRDGRLAVTAVVDDALVRRGALRAFTSSCFAPTGRRTPGASYQRGGVARVVARRVIALAESDRRYLAARARLLALEFRQKSSGIVEAFDQ